MGTFHGVSVLVAVAAYEVCAIAMTAAAATIIIKLEKNIFLCFIMTKFIPAIFQRVAEW